MLKFFFLTVCRFYSLNSPFYSLFGKRGIAGIGTRNIFILLIYPQPDRRIKLLLSDYKADAQYHYTNPANKFLDSFKESSQFHHVVAESVHSNFDSALLLQYDHNSCCLYQLFFNKFRLAVCCQPIYEIDLYLGRLFFAIINNLLRAYPFLSRKIFEPGYPIMKPYLSLKRKSCKERRLVIA